jgi:hypothetical protein
MDNRVQIVGIIASILVIILIFEFIRRKKIKEEYSLLWFSVGLLFLLLSIWRDGLEFISKLIGIAYPPATLFLVLLFGIFIILVHFSIVISKLSEKNKLLAQELGLFKLEFDELKKKLQKEKKNENSDS